MAIYGGRADRLMPWVWDQNTEVVVVGYEPGMGLYGKLLRKIDELELTEYDKELLDGMRIAVA